jgi:hypothetical protein
MPNMLPALCYTTRQIFNEPVPALLRDRVIRLDASGIDRFGAFLGRSNYYSAGFRATTNLDIDSHVTWWLKRMCDETGPDHEH